MYLKINSFLRKTQVEGPGFRFAIWVQGCNKRCPGCAVPGMWPFDGGYEIEVDDLALIIINTHNIDGITISGGEPLLQAENLLKLIKKVKKNSNLSVLVYTGYTLKFIKKTNKDSWNKLLKYIDILIDGPYIQEVYTEKTLMGSSNQKIHYLSDKYINLSKNLLNEPKRIEFHISKDSYITVTGDISNSLLLGITDKFIKK